MYVLIEAAGVVAEMLLVHIYLNGFFEKRPLPDWTIAFAYMVSGIFLCLLSLVPNAAFLRLAFYAASIGLIAYFCFQASILQAAYASISYCGLYVLNEMLIYGLFSLLHIDANAMMSLGNTRGICIITSHTLLWLCVLAVLAMTNRRRMAITVPFLLALTPGYMAGILLGLSFCSQVLSGNDKMTIPVLISAIGLLYLNILIVLYAERAKSASDKRLQSELAEHHYIMQEQYYEQLHAEQEETRAMFHDINKSLQAMRALASEANTEGAASLLSETQKIFDDLGTVVDVGNSIVSIILNEYCQLANASDIPFQYDVSIPPTLRVTAVDLYVLLGNTLDNAIEACKFLPKEQRYIHLQLRAVNEMLFLQVKNPYCKDYPLRVRGKNHGYGLQNVRKCVKKYDGDISTQQQNGVFLLSLRLNNCVSADQNTLTKS